MPELEPLDDAVTRITDPVFTLDAAGVVTGANEAARRLLAEPAVEAILPHAIELARRRRRPATVVLPATSHRSAVEVRLYPADDGLTAIATPMSTRPASVGSDQSAILDSIREVFLACDQDWRVTFVNARAEPYLQVLGLERHDLIGQVLWKTLPFLAGTDVHRGALRAVEEQRAIEIEINPGPFDRWFAVRISPTADGVVSYSRDITVRKAAEDEIRRLNADLRRQEQAQRALAGASVALNSSLDYAATLAAVARMAVPGMADYCLVDLLDDAGEVQRVEFAHAVPEKEARLRAVSLSHAPQTEWGGHPISRALATGELTFIPEMTTAELAVIARDADHLAYLTDLGPRSLISVPMAAHGRTLGAITFCFAESGRRYSQDDLSFARDLAGRAGLAVVNARLYRAAQSELAQRAQAEADLRKWAHIFEHAGWGVVIVSADGTTFEAVNPAFARMHGYEPADLLGQSPAMLLAAPDAIDFAERIAVVREEGRRVFESRHVDREGRELAVLVDLAAIRDDDGVLLYYAANVQDLRERRRAEEQVRQAQKMEAVGRLAGGIAHDFNNMLMIIIGFADFLCHNIDEDDPRRRDAEEIRKAAERAAALTRQLLAFGRQQLVRPQLVDMNAVVRDMELMLRPLLGEDITLESSLPEVGAVRADRGRLEQVVMNLALNARDAMTGGGRLYIETRSVVLAEGAAYRQFGMDMPAGRYVRLVVRDTGEGMAPGTRARIFEPFFTTKPPTQNSGLGLSVVYGIVSQSDGYLWVESQPQHGTSFTIWLPEVAAAAEPATPQPLPAAGGTERVLVVEDEAAVRSLAARVLTEAGYSVVEASDGGEALQMLEGGLVVDVVLTDVVMPGVGGVELAERLQEQRPGLPVLFMSGYTGSDVVRRGLNQRGVPFLQKPFSPLSLTARLRELLDAQ